MRAASHTNTAGQTGLSSSVSPIHSFSCSPCLTSVSYCNILTHVATHTPLTRSNIQTNTHTHNHTHQLCLYLIYSRRWLCQIFCHEVIRFLDQVVSLITRPKPLQVSRTPFLSPSAITTIHLSQIRTTIKCLSVPFSRTLSHSSCRLSLSTLSLHSFSPLSPLP